MEAPRRRHEPIEAPIEPARSFLVDNDGVPIPCDLQRDGASCPAPAVAYGEHTTDGHAVALCNEHRIKVLLNVANRTLGTMKP